MPSACSRVTSLSGGIKRREPSAKRRLALDWAPVLMRSPLCSVAPAASGSVAPPRWRVTWPRANTASATLASRLSQPTGMRSVEPGLSRSGSGTRLSFCRSRQVLGGASHASVSVISVSPFWMR